MQPIFGVEMIPKSECPYQAPDSCSGFEPQTCCERVQLAAGDHGVNTASVSLFSLIGALCTAYFILHS